MGKVVELFADAPKRPAQVHTQRSARGSTYGSTYGSKRGSKRESAADAGYQDAPVYNPSKKPRWRDTAWVLIFALFLIGFVILAVVDLCGYSRTKCYLESCEDPREIYYEPHMLAVLAICILIACVLSLLYQFVASACTSNFIVISMAIQITTSLGTSIFYLVQKQWISGVVCMLWLVCTIVVYAGVRHYIDMASTQLKITMKVANKNPTMLIIIFLGALFCAGWATLTLSVSIAGFSKTVYSECALSHRKRPMEEYILLLTYNAMCFYLVAEFIKGVIRITISYTYGCWAIMPHVKEPSTKRHKYIIEEFENLPKASCLGILTTYTYSLGTLCVSSIILAVIKLATLVLVTWSQALIVNAGINTSPDIAIVLLVWASSIGISYLDSALSHFTNYVLIFAAVDNNSYLKACSRAVDLIMSEGIHAVAMDCLAAGSLTCPSWCIGTVTAFSSYIFMRWIRPHPSEGFYIVCYFVMLAGVQVSGILLSAISTGVQTLFIITSVEPARFQQIRPNVYRALNVPYLER